ncbi:sigma factor-like helix-turn-helix DNA-binding protein [uncultured Vagococcus sp.]|uniref:sigma factor-like helix-turn-helix DNA-binding protein n=1 Tax=uncultured Vagococcus sp. TaxID=189676 RepID=UPI0037DCDA62
MSRLNELYRLPTIMTYFDNRTYKEISDLLDIPLTTLKYRLYREKNNPIRHGNLSK